MLAHRKIGPKSAVLFILATFVIFLTVSCAYYFPSMGRIVEGLDSVVYVDIQRENAVSVGQELNAYQAIMYTKEDVAISPSKGVQTGKVKITEILDNHLAKAVVISGNAEKGEVVELVRSK